MKIDERVVGGFLIIILLALWINFDPTLASLFFAMVLGAFILVTTDTVKTFKIESKTKQIKKSYVWSSRLYYIFIIFYVYIIIITKNSLVQIIQS